MTSSSTSACDQATPSINSEDLEALRESVEKVLARECDSRAVHAYIDGKTALSQLIWARASEQGWLAAALPEQWGGLGLGPLGLQVLHFEFGRRTAPGPFIASLSVAQWIAEVAPTDVKARYLPLLASGELKAAAPSAFGSSALDLTNSKLNGRVEVLGSEDSGLVAVPIGKGGKAESWALVEPNGSSAKLERTDIWDRTRDLCVLNCDGASVAALLPEADGSLGRSLRSHILLALAADSLGAATNIYEQTTEYLKTRVQFDKPIATFQAIKHRVADMVISVAVKRHIVDQAAETLAQRSPDAEMWSALAKAGATEAFAFVSGDCIQLHGGVGHTWEFDPHIYAKRARLNEALGATNRALLDFATEALASATREKRVTTTLGI